jgi:Zn-dependent metalloprotease
VAALLALTPAGAAAQSSSRGAELKRELGPQTRVAVHAETDRVRFVGGQVGAPISRPAGFGPSASPAAVARAFLEAHAGAFGVADPAGSLAVRSVESASKGRSVVRLQQAHGGVRVIGGEFVVNLDAQRNVLSASGEAVPKPDVSTEPAVSAADARANAIEAVAKARGVPAARLATSAPALWIYDSRLMGGPGLGVPTLVWRMDVTSESAFIDEFVLVDAQLGAVVLRFDQLESALNRQICDAANTTSHVPCTAPVRTEGGPPHPSIPDVNNAYVFSGDTYDFFLDELGRDSLDGAGMTLKSTTRYCAPSQPCPFANAFWNGEQMVYGQGFASADDVVGHELAHGVTDHTSRLFYYYQSGAINESLSDVFGEFVDLTNTSGTDTAATRWLMGEDLPGGAIRDMADPPAEGDPDRMTSPNYTADPSEGDRGGVHFNSGVNNKAAFLMTDGGTFNSETVSPVGLSEVAKIYYEVEANRLTSASDYADLYNALKQACTDLVGTAGITAADCVEVGDAVDAVEMNVPPPAAPNPEAAVCAVGEGPQNLFLDDLENTGSGNWTKMNIAGANHWYYPQNSHAFPNFDATYASSGETNIWGWDHPTTADFAIAMTNDVALPAGSTPFLHFKHGFGFEDGFDGGVLEYSTNNGGSWADAAALFTTNGYNGTVGTSNPLPQTSVFTAESNGYISTRANLASLAGQNVRFRFRIGTDSSVEDLGWFIDDVRIYTCQAGTNAAPIADAGGPYTLSEGQPLQLNGSGSSDPDGDTLTYAWDLDGDNDFADGLTGPGPTVTPATLNSLGRTDGPSTFDVALRVTDPSNEPDSDDAGVTLGNAAPTASVTGPLSATVNESAIWTLSATDPSPTDLAGQFTYEIDWDGNDSVDETVTGDSSESVAHTFTGAGPTLIRATATDKDGGESAEATTSASLGLGPGEQELPPDTTGPNVGLAASGLRMNRRGVVSVPVSCPLEELAGCSGAVRLKTARKVGKRKVTLGSAPFTVGAGQTGVARVRLSRANRRLVRRRAPLRVKVTATAFDGLQNPATATATIPLRPR